MINFCEKHLSRAVDLVVGEMKRGKHVEVQKDDKKCKFCRKPESAE